MKLSIIFFIVIIIQSCNRSEKSHNSETSAIKQRQIDTIKVSNKNSKHVVFTPERETEIKKDSLSRIKKAFPYMLKHSFDQYKAAVFSGKPASPNFNSNPYAEDTEYVAFITQGCKRGINFGGHYTIFEKGCGTFCQQLFIVDRCNGKIFTDPIGLKQQDGYYGFTYKKDSFLLIANSTSLIDASNDEMDEFSTSLKPEIFRWKDEKFIQIE